MKYYLRIEETKIINQEPEEINQIWFLVDELKLTSYEIFNENMRLVIKLQTSD